MLIDVYKTAIIDQASLNRKTFLLVETGSDPYTIVPEEITQKLRKREPHIKGKSFDDYPLTELNPCYIPEEVRLKGYYLFRSDGETTIN